MNQQVNEKSYSTRNVSPDMVYQELYEEMRLHRNYELNISTWYTAILLSLSGVIFAVRFNSTPALPIIERIPIKIVFSGIIFLLMASGVFSAYYASSRYRELRRWVDENLEPTWKCYHPKHFVIRPIHVIILTQIIITCMALVGLWI